MLLQTPEEQWRDKYNIDGLVEEAQDKLKEFLYTHHVSDIISARCIMLAIEDYYWNAKYD